MLEPEASFRILNVDDDEGARYAKTRMLQAGGFVVMEAATGAETLRIVRQESPDLVLLDVKLPDINGLEVCRQIKTDPATSSILVLQTSAALIHRLDKVRALESGADNYLVAPIEAEELIANINALLRLKQARQESTEYQKRLLALAAATTDVIYGMSADWTEMHNLDGRGFLVSSVAGNRNWLEEYIPSDQHSLVMSTVQHAIRTKSLFELEHRVRRADGSLGWIYSRAIPILDASGSITEWLGAASDVTERRLYIEKLRRADQRIQLALDAGAVAGTWFWDVAENCMTADVRFARTFGMDAAELEAGVPLAHAVESIHPEDRPRVLKLVESALSEGVRYRAEYRVKQADGVYRWIEANGDVIRDENGHAVSFPGVLVDLHQRKLAELRQAALLQLGDRLRGLDEPAQIAAVAAEIVGETLEVNRAGYGTVDPIAATVEMQPDWRADRTSPSVSGYHRFADYGSYIEDLKKGRVIAIPDVRCDVRTAPNQQSWLALNVVALLNVPLMNTSGLAGVFLAHHDELREWTSEEIDFIKGVADRTWVAMAKAEATQALRRMNENLELLAAERTADRNRLWQLSNDLMLVAEFNGVITAINPAWEQLLGWTEDDLVGSSFFDLVHPDDMSRTINAAKGIENAGVKLPGFENRYRHRDGSYRWIGWAAGPGEGFIVAVGRDKTEEKQQGEALSRAEEQLRQSQKMEAVGQLTGGLAHDFNNLLVGISGNLEMISILMSQGKLDDLERFIVAAQDASARAAALTHRLLAFSRRQTLDPKATNVSRLIDGMEDLIQRTIGPAIALDIAKGEEAWPILVDPPQLETALLNLCINARDAMPDGGRLTIEAANSWLDDGAPDIDLSPGPYVVLSVRDTGTGMPGEVIAKAFDPFFTTKPMGKGTGLGLSMVYGFARQSGGAVRIRSEVGRGTSMQIYLPRHFADAEEPSEKLGVPIPVHAKHALSVLVVDDEPAIRLAIIELLKELGYTASEAATGMQGLDILRSNKRIDLLVTDVGLGGGMNGRQLADAARISHPELRVLFITGYADAAVLGKNDLEPGMQIMVKPFTLDNFARRIGEMTAQ